MIRKRVELTLADLIEEAEELTRRLRDLQERHLPDLEVVTEENRPIRFPLELNWRPYENEPMPSQLAAEVIEWIRNSLDVHVGNLTRYFANWKEQGDRLYRFPLVRYPNLPLDGLFACLEEHRDLLRIEEMKEHAVSPEEPAPAGSTTTENHKSPIAVLREEAALPQEQLADKADADPLTRKRSDTNRVKPRSDTLRGSTEARAKQLHEAGPGQAEPRWVTAPVFAKSSGLSTQTLANWRYLDKKAGRDHAAPGYPEYRRHGRAVRYLLTTEPPEDAEKA